MHPVQQLTMVDPVASEKRGGVLHTYIGDDAIKTLDYVLCKKKNHTFHIL